MTDQIKISPNEVVELPIPQSSKKNVLAVNVGVFIGVLLLLIFWWSRRDQAVVSEAQKTVNSEEITDQLSPSQTPFLFEDMTIPYLRQRDYVSRWNLQEKIGETASYTSYLTGYDSDGLNINGLLLVPKGEPPAGGFPAIVFVHGYIPPTLYRTQEKYTDYINYLARNGFVVFKIDLRGHDKSDGEPGGAYYSSDYIIDTLNARAALQKSEFVNPQAVGLWGHSMAGNVVMRSLAVRPEIPAVAIWGGAVYTYSDMQKYGIQDNSYRPPSSSVPSRRRRQELFDQYGQFSPESEFWKLIPATNYLSDIKGAVGLFHAVNDDVVDIGYSRDLKPLLDTAGVKNELNEYSSGGHNISGSAFTQAMQDTVNFYKTYLQ